MKRLIILIVLAAVAVGALWYFGDTGDATPQYQTAVVGRGEVIQAVTATGQLAPLLNVTVGSQISGRISRLYADFNSIVKSNQIVAELDPSTFKAAVQRAEADLSSAMASLELARLEAGRAAQLFTNNLISSSDHDTAIANLHQAEAAALIRQAALDSARVDLSRCTIYAPVDGIVISRNVDVGQTVAASMSAPVLFQIANDLTKMQIDANVSEADIGMVEEGQTVNFTVDAFTGRQFAGTVKQIRNAFTVVQNVVTYDCVIEVSNPDLKLRPGMTATASLITAHRTGVLKVPNAALRFKPPEPSTNKTLLAKILMKIGIGGDAKSAATNAVVVVAANTTNKVEVAANGETPLTGNEPPEELQRRVREMRDRGDDVPPEIMAKLREYYQSGVLQRPNRGGGPGGGGGGGGGAGGGGGQRGGGGGGLAARASQPTSRTVYLAVTDPASGEIKPQPVRVRTGISDGAFTEILDGLKEGDVIISSIKFATTAAAAPSSGASPFGGGGGGGGFRGGGR